MGFDKVTLYVTRFTRSLFETSIKLVTFLILSFSGGHLFDHFLWSIFQSSLHILQITIFSHIGPLWAAFTNCIYTCLSDLWVLFMLVLLFQCVFESHIVPFSCVSKLSCCWRTVILVVSFHISSLTICVLIAAIRGWLLLLSCQKELVELKEIATHG